MLVVLTHLLVHRFRSAKTCIALGILAPIGMLVISGLMLFDLRMDAWEKAEQTSKNLLQVLERDIVRNIEIIDLSLQAVVDNLRAPGVADATPEMRQLVLFDRAATARDLGAMVVLDDHGHSIADAFVFAPRKLNNADREYFQAHKDHPQLGLLISKPLFSRLTGSRIIVLSRRINKPDGSFGGIVLGSLKLSYFDRLFDQIGLGRDGAINLYLRDGTRVMRYPFDAADIGVNLAGTSNFDRFVRERSGSFISTSVRDRVERHYTFTQVGDWPLVLNVALGTKEIEADWRAKALIIGFAVSVLCGLTVALSILFGRELHRRASVEAELARLSCTDALTGLPNRRQFEDMSDRAWDSAQRTSRPLSLLVVDADHFKRYNDRYGHAVGDEVLKGLARCLTASVYRPEDLVCRVGGEEFVVILPGTDEAGAQSVAERIHAEMSALAVGPASIEAGSVTVSIGVASAVPDAASGTTMARLYGQADAALYDAKAGGRNQTRCARATEAGSDQRPVLRSVGAA
ncbi:sensor domain-containing diguanylate cyclase [Methylobacterium radiotolerans]|uniref:sensor domain-containing diguanylate cyclase n=1 Tax=Methylobacterium radiotolerans TaxID=31998 RepID=UPI0038D150BB